MVKYMVSNYKRVRSYIYLNFLKNICTGTEYYYTDTEYIFDFFSQCSMLLL